MLLQSSTFDPRGLEDGRAESFFDYLPDETVMRVFGYLPAKDLCRAGLVCWRWHEIGEHPSLWQFMAKQNGWMKQNLHGAKQWYKRKHVEERERKAKEEEEKRRRAEARRQEQLRQHIRDVNLRISCSTSSRVHDWLMYIMLVLETVFVCLKVGGQLQWSWGATLWPSWIVIIYLMAIRVLYDALACSEYYRHLHFINKFPATGVIGWANWIQYNNNSNDTSTNFDCDSSLISIPFYMIEFSIFLSMILFTCWGDYGSVPSWAIPIPPLITLTICSICVPILGIVRDDEPPEHFYFVVVTALLAVFLLVMILDFAGVMSANWSAYFTPTWLLFAACMFLPPLCSSCCKYNRKIHYHDEKAFFHVCGLAVMLPTLFAFQIMLALYLAFTWEHTIAVLFIPLFLFIGCFGCWCGAMDIYFCCQK
eukprot:TRINITY_DN447_c0_g1_i5.p1 TRINITY_DN447_c0_g1~~TRINITY_DN447_c0_g1_i5.p1  ORF type:complete len:422 (+),score=143.87 TRINITY_DN447_c0_g1_i5:111-1376(+)